MDGHVQGSVNLGRAWTSVFLFLFFAVGAVLLALLLSFFPFFSVVIPDKSRSPVVVISHCLPSSLAVIEVVIHSTVLLFLPLWEKNNIILKTAHAGIWIIWSTESSIPILIEFLLKEKCFRLQDPYQQCIRDGCVIVSLAATIHRRPETGRWSRYAVMMMRRLLSLSFSLVASLPFVFRRLSDFFALLFQSLNFPRAHLLPSWLFPIQ